MPERSSAGLFTFRRLDPASPEALELLRRSDRTMAALYPSESNHLDGAADLAKPNVTFLGAYADEALLGCGAVKLLEDDGVYGEIKRVFVPEQHRGRGIAKAIMAELEAGMASAGVAVARLETGVRQPEAIALYRRLGYRERGPFGGYRPDPLSVFMEKRLASALAPGG